MPELAAKHHLFPRLWITRILRSSLRVAPFWIAVLAADVAHGGLSPTRACPPLLEPHQSLWAAADFDGDKSVDVARVKIGRAGNRILASPVDLFPFCRNSAPPIFRSSLDAGLVLTVRDVDADHDPDLILRKPFAAKALNVWLNDGKGRFTETAPSTTSGTDPNPLGMASPVSRIHQLAAASSPKTHSPILWNTALVPFEPECARLSHKDPLGVASVRRGARQGRAPPSLSF
jgi:hypothetical protein